jgi:hypothetical protein
LPEQPFPSHWSRYLLPPLRKLLALAVPPVLLRVLLLEQSAVLEWPSLDSRPPHPLLRP